MRYQLTTCVLYNNRVLIQGYKSSKHCRIDETLDHTKHASRTITHPIDSGERTSVVIVSCDTTCAYKVNIWLWAYLSHSFCMCVCVWLWTFDEDSESILIGTITNYMRVHFLRNKGWTNQCDGIDGNRIKGGTKMNRKVCISRMLVVSRNVVKLNTYPQLMTFRTHICTHTLLYVNASNVYENAKCNRHVNNVQLKAIQRASRAVIHSWCWWWQWCWCCWRNDDSPESAK